MTMIINKKKYASLREVGEMLDCSTARLRKLLAEQRIQGAIKSPTDAWYIPLPVRIECSDRRSRKIPMRAY